MSGRNKENVHRMMTKNHNKKKNFIDTAVKTVSACEKFLNCGYIGSQLEMERHEDVQQLPMQTPVEQLFNRLDQGFEVEVYRQFLFEEQNSLEPSFDHQMGGAATAAANGAGGPHDHPLSGGAGLRSQSLLESFDDDSQGDHDTVGDHSVTSAERRALIPMHRITSID
mmetsp:Transcript_18672/g.24500  ORF Transcript_18672/g.24500 Transcript_18672/m.24500 type:complete len:168 (-) Transcript_18672:562-1065(-)